MVTGEKCFLNTHTVEGDFILETNNRLVPTQLISIYRILYVYV